MKAKLALLAILPFGLGTPALGQSDDAQSRYLANPTLSYPGGVTSQRDLTYAEISGYRPLTLDLYLPPKGRRPHPVVIFVHGGGFLHRSARDGGTFRDFPAVLASVAARGYIVASVNYRFSGEVKFPGAVQDVGRAIQWIRRNAGKYDADPDHVVLWGSSAGGQLASLIGTACNEPAFQPPGEGDAPSTCVQGVIDWYGVIDFENTALDLGQRKDAGFSKIEKSYFGCDRGQCPAGLIRSASPLAYIDAGDPPFLLQHGTADITVSPKQAERLYSALRSKGVSAQLVLYPGVSHGFASVPEGGPDDTINAQAMAKIFEFLGNVAPRPDR